MGELKVRFLPEGGFNKNGAFIEYAGEAPSGNEAEYQRQGYLTLDLICTDFKLGTSFGVVSEYEEVKERKHRRSISANGKIQPARWGKYSLSFLGENGSTRDIAISIHENAEGEAATLSGLNIEGDLDLEGHHYFFLELHVKQERFSTLSKELSTPGAALHISVRSDRFRDFYAEWSPSISEGRVIKFLDRKRDVENADEIPESFWLTPEFQRELIAPEWLKEVLCIADLVLIPVRCQRRSKIRPLWRSKSRPVWGERLGACGPHIASPVQGALAVRPIL